MKTQILVDEPPNNPPIEDLPILDLEKKFAFETTTIANEIIGLDSIVLPDGTIAIIYLSNEESLLKPPTIDDIIKFLSQNSKGKSNTFVTYYPHILEAIVKMLGEEDCRTLIQKGNIGTGYFKVWYTPGNRLTITQKGRTFRLFALGNWFEKRTDKYTLERLGIEKAHGIGAFGYKKLADRINQIVSPIVGVANLRNGDLSSPTVLTKRFLYSDYRKFNPETIPWEVYQLAYNCIHAPWVEMYQQGTFNEVWDYDINSAYPSEIAKLYWVDGLNGEWIKVDGENWKSPKDRNVKPTYGFYIAKITLKPYTPSPIQLRYKDRLIAPYGDWIGYITLQEIEFIEKYNIGKIDVINGWEFFVKNQIHPFARTTRIIAELRALAINNEDYFSNYIFKRASARTVGKFLQRTEKLDGIWEISPTFNPIYAAIVMTNIKIRIAEIIRGLGKRTEREENILSITVDGFVSSKEIGVYGRKDRIGELKWNKYEDVTIAAPLITTLPHHHLNLKETLENEQEAKAYLFDLEKPRISICEALAVGNFNSAVHESSGEHITLIVGRDYKRIWTDIPIRGKDLLEEQFISEQRDTDSLIWEEQMAENIRRSRREAQQDANF